MHEKELAVEVMAANIVEGVANAGRVGICTRRGFRLSRFQRLILINGNTEAPWRSWRGTAFVLHYN